MRSACRILSTSIFLSVLLFGIPGTAHAFTYGDLGGDDISILENWHIYRVSMDIASNGDIYLAGQYYHSTGNMAIRVFRSQDGGTTWDPWGDLKPGTGEDDDFTDPCLKVVEGVVAKCYLAYTHGSSLFTPRIMMASSDLSDVLADFSAPVAAMSNAGVVYGRPRFDTDVASFSSFNIYLVAETNISGTDIIFTRSTDQGTTFETPYLIGNLVPTDRDYIHPDVSYGFGGYVNVAWEFLIDDTTYDSALRFRRASNSAASGISDWTGIYGLGSTSDGEANNRPRVRASATGSEVVLAYERQSAVKGTAGITDPGVYVSTNSGSTYTASATIPDGVVTLGEIVEQPGTGNWFICGTVDYKSGIHRANVADLTSWTPLETFVDHDYNSHSSIRPSMALNPADAHQPAMSWVFFDYNLDDVLHFDADWRGDPGYPNLEPGFPVVLADQPRSDPAVVDVNGDGDLEIVFGDSNGNIQIFQHDGTPLPGWPVNIGEPLSTSPIAVGDVKGNGEMYIVAGAQSGRVHCYNPLGQIPPGNWPAYVDAGTPAFVAIAALGQGPFPRGIVTAIGTRMRCYTHRAAIYPGSVTVYLSGPANNAPAVGDINGDGLADVVFSADDAVVAVNIFVSAGSIMNKSYSVPLSGSPTLGDIDQNGDLDIVVPLEDGTLHVYDGTGVELPGFPFVSPTGSALSSAAIGQMLGNAEPEIVTAARDYQVHLLWYDGVEGNGWPAYTDGWANYASPVIGRVEGSSSDVALGSRGEQAWGWDNFANVIGGWPKACGGNIYQTPAMGDIDLDGSNEIVFLTTTRLLVVDVQEVPNDPTRTWGMAGHDPQRTNCSDCPNTTVSDVDEIGGVTQVSFAAPSPNPSSGSATFRFAVPGPAVVNLEVFDVRGHRVSLVTREEVGAGNHVASWGGLGDRGAPLASGVYFARLRVDGPGISEELTRKITLTR